MKHAQLVSRLRHFGGASLSFQQALEQAFSVDETLINHNDHEKRVLALIEEAEKEGSLKLPSRKYKNNWFQRGSIAVPSWIRIVSPEKAIEAKIDPYSISWVPCMGWAVKLNQGQLKSAAKVNQFFLAGGSKYEISINERSLQIFGDEKVLKDMLKTKWFKESGLTLGDLGCYVEFPPLVIKRFRVAARRAIIIENLDTFHSFCKWNAVAEEYSMILYGSGNQFSASYGSLRDLTDELHQENVVFEYFGDLDPAGFHIPAYASNELKELVECTQIVPATRFYIHSLQAGLFRPIKGDSQKNKILSELAIGWMPEEIEEDVLTLISEGLMIPQEVINYEILMTQFI